MNNVDTQEKLEYLKQLYDSFGEYELWYAKDYDWNAKQAIPGWTSWKPYSQCDEKELAEANLRSVFKEEVILDIDDSARYEPVVEELRHWPVSFTAFKSGSRGYHVHIIFPELKPMATSAVVEIKKSIIDYFKTDQAKNSSHNLIALEYEQHFKIKDRVVRKDIVEVVQRGQQNELNMFLAVTRRLRDLRLRDPKFNDVFGGAWQQWGYPSRSEAELGICTTLAMDGFSATQIVAIMDQCKVGKWQEQKTKDGTLTSYQKHTLTKAIEYASAAPRPIEDTLENASLFQFFEEFGVPGPVRWLVNDYIPAKGVVIFAGPPGCGKSFLTEEFISALLNKRPFCGHFKINDDRPVILIDQENDHSILYERLMNLGGIPKQSLLLFNFDYNFDVQNEALVDMLLKRITELDPSVVLFDTLRRTYSGDENDSKTINLVYKRVLGPIAKQRCCMLIAHTRKGSKDQRNGSGPSDEMSEIRGTGDITGLATAVFMLRKNIDNTITIKPAKMRPAQVPDPFTLRISHAEDTIKFEFLGATKALASEAEQLADRIFEWLQHNVNPMGIVKTREILKGMPNEDSRRVREAIPILIGKGVLHRDRKGYYQFTYGEDSISRFITEAA